jgi:putative flippase GtrA
MSHIALTVPADTGVYRTSLIQSYYLDRIWLYRQNMSDRIHRAARREVNVTQDMGGHYI